jgi:uncharacterized protein (TIGR00255 family)
MTGYGKGEARQGSLAVTVEVRAVNHRYADISVKLPRSLLAFENALRKQVAQVLQRGKIDVLVNYEVSAEAQAAPVLNRELAAAYHGLLIGLQQELGLEGGISAEFIASQKDVVQVRETEIDEDVLSACLERAVDSALAQHLDMRRAEGEETRRNVAERLTAAEELLRQVEARAPQVPLEWQERLNERLARLQSNLDFDPQRVAQEIALYSDRCDISEEVARFRSHLCQFRSLFDDLEPVGRRMDFLVQELNREVNTMGSKSNDAELTRHVVAMKAELEKVREQVQNLE